MNLNDQHTAFIFPGQGSQALGMGVELAEIFPLAKETFEEADQLLGFPISQMMWEGPKGELDDTINTQPALMVHSVAALRTFQERYPDFNPAFVAGHSMGELSALVAGSALSFPESLALVRRRGELMKFADEVSPGAMAAILGLDIPTLEGICDEASAGEDLVLVANDNCPGQVVISGARPALERAVDMAKEAGARRAVILAISIAAHSPLMAHAQADFNQAVDSAKIAAPDPPIIANITAEPMYTAVQVREDLRGQLTNRVRWTESVEYMISHGVDTFLEIGSGSVLCGLIKRIDRSAACIPLGKPEDFERLSTQEA